MPNNDLTLKSWFGYTFIIAIIWGLFGICARMLDLSFNPHNTETITIIQFAGERIIWFFIGWFILMILSLVILGITYLEENSKRKANDVK